jgi:threonyl-tRNA synthetase
LNTCGFKYRYRLSTRDTEHPEKYIGDPKTWDKVEKWSEKIMIRNKIDHFDGPGEATFYAPKMDLIAEDSLGREWQLSTVQIDFFLPERFKLTYKDKDGKDKRPVMIHRAILGSTERLMAILIEHHAGAFPVWLSPVQAIIVPITDKHNKFGQEFVDRLREQNIRVELDDRSETTSAKIRNAELQKIPYILVVGDKEIDQKAINVRVRGEKVLGLMTTDKFLALIKEDIDKKRQF